MHKLFQKRVKKLDYWDLKLIKWGAVAAALFLLTAWPWLQIQAMKVHWGVYLAAMVILILRPLIKFWIKK
jgi:hypothetical protein